MTEEVLARDRLIVALDTDPKDAMALARSLQNEVAWVKVGMTLFYEAGPEIVARLAALGFRVFLDLKLHDIPHQVAGAAATLGRLGVGMLTVHASGGAEMVAAAVRGAAQGASEAEVPAPAVLAVTVLTSMDDDGLQSIGVRHAAAEQVPLLAHVARHAGASGVVCSAHEAAAMREILGEKAYVVTPGIRPAGSAAGDQSRVATPADALVAGASHLVVGRPITDAAVPAEAAAAIVREMEGVAQWPSS